MDGGVEADAMGALDKVTAIGAVEGVAACHRAVYGSSGERCGGEWGIGGCPKKVR